MAGGAGWQFFPKPFLNRGGLWDAAWRTNEPLGSAINEGLAGSQMWSLKRHLRLLSFCRKRPPVLGLQARPQRGKQQRPQRGKQQRPPQRSGYSRWCRTLGGDGSPRK